MNTNTIILYPSNWLYNAGVIGLLEVQEKAKGKIEEALSSDGSYHLYTDYFDEVKLGTRTLPKAIVHLTNYLVSDEELDDWLRKLKQDKLKAYEKFETELGELGYSFIRVGNKLFASKTPYQNLVQLSEWQSYEFANLVQEIPTLIASKENQMCDLCRENPITIKDPQSKLQTRLTRLQSTHLKGLGPSIGEFPNGFWNMNQSMKICFLCAFLIIHHHLAFTRLSDGSDIFINAPSFRVMYELNKLIKELYGTITIEEQKTKRNILAMSVIEYALKTKITLGTWTGMNLEIITRRRENIEFFSLPYDVIELISDRHIAAQLSDIGEFKILNLVLNRDFAKLPELGYRLLCQALADPQKRNEKFINEWLFLWNNKGNNLQRTAEKILRLYALIEQKKKRSVVYGNNNYAII